LDQGGSEAVAEVAEVTVFDRGLEVEVEDKIVVILDSHNISSSAVSPATDDLFRTRDLPLLPKIKQDQLRSTVAKLLYISTHVRPDILLPVNFLCSRAEKFDADDELKLNHISTRDEFCFS
jgi:hypothetical protein